MIAVTLPVGPRGASAARRLLSATLAEAGCAEELIDRVVLVGSELVANAVVHGVGSPRLRLSVLPDGARVEVYDASPGLPEQPPPDDTMTTGRGMLIVSRSSNSWGTQPEGRGKWVWAEFSAVDRIEPPDSGDGTPAARHPVGVRLNALLRAQSANRWLAST